MNLKELTVIKQAMINEVEGYEFYRLAAKQTENEEAKSAFETLAKEELMHVEWLREIYSSLGSATGGNITFAIEAPTQQIFNWDNIDRGNTSLAVSVFGIAIQMERSSVDFYNSAAEDTDIQELKKIYNTLALWEQQHLEQFADEYDKLKEEWWDTQAFEPM